MNRFSFSAALFLVSAGIAYADDPAVGGDAEAGEVAPAAAGAEPRLNAVATELEASTARLKQLADGLEKQKDQLDRLQSQYETDKGSFHGDHVNLNTAIPTAVLHSADITDTTIQHYCLPPEARVRLGASAGSGYISASIVQYGFSFLGIGRDTDDELKNLQVACNVAGGITPLDNKTTLPVAQKGVQYKVPLSDIQSHDLSRSGYHFGALIVPFKYYIGDDKEIKAAATIAPFLGWRVATARGMSFSPIVTAGLGVVQVNDPTEKSTDTVSTLTLGTGLLMTSAKNEKWSAGVLWGQDKISKEDRAKDPVVAEHWISLFIGISL